MKIRKLNENASDINLDRITGTLPLIDFITTEKLSQNIDKLKNLIVDKIDEFQSEIVELDSEYQSNHKVRQEIANTVADVERAYYLLRDGIDRLDEVCNSYKKI